MDKPDLSFPELKQLCEEGLRNGQFSLVARILSQIKTSQIPREYLLIFAQIARRASQISFGLRILRPMMTMQAQGFSTQASPQEKAEYGVLLQRYGSVSEALKILNLVSTEDVPESLLYRSFCHFPRWEYDKAWPLLIEYVRHPALNDYQRLIGRVNLASAAIVLKRWDEGEKLLTDLRAQTKHLSLKRLLTNTLELSAQLEIQRKNFAQARIWLEEGAGLLQGEDSLDVLFLEKWRAVLAAESGDLEKLRHFRKRAIAKKHWESLRESDLYLMKYEKDLALCRHLYAGSPYEAYRQRILESAPDQFQVPDEYVMGSGENLLDLPEGLWQGRDIFNKGKKIHLLLQFIMSDFYRPRRMATLFSEIFSDQSFDILSSPNRVHQIVKRSRELLEEQNIPLLINEEKGNYHFHAPPDLRVRLALHPPALSAEELRLQTLSKRFPSQSFTAKEARLALDLPLTTYHRWMQWALSAGHLARLGQGPHVRYQILINHSKSA